jgi:hypothetical protein
MDYRENENRAERERETDIALLSKHLFETKNIHVPWDFVMKKAYCITASLHD